ncbi:hypothetical protein OUZ56_019192 [Daphnia magna]|uniref:Uncharacterized protein n=1 Tax=Daphnia magna TaxID=35525 RepID=A0ABQ9ZAX2_9CRUS|nr:hypothetical protein OUZ56_019192 [Daphnia magna]
MKWKKMHTYILNKSKPPVSTPKLTRKKKKKDGAMGRQPPKAFTVRFFASELHAVPFSVPSATFDDVRETGVACLTWQPTANYPSRL